MTRREHISPRRPRGPITSGLRASLLAGLAGALLSGCASLGDVPAALRVDTGTDPEYQDDNVRFRTTYYFRILDSCRLDARADKDDDYEVRVGTFRAKKHGKIKVVSDTLYRFRMTGKASALYSDIHFESGVLRAEQIDPFGSAVVYDDKDRTFRVRSGSVRRAKARRDAIYAEIGNLRALYQDLAKDPDLGDELKADVQQLARDQLQLLAEGTSLTRVEGEDRQAQREAVRAGIDRLRTLHKNINEDEALSDELKTEIQHLITNQVQQLAEESTPHPDAGPVDRRDAVLCPDGRPAKRSYLLYGPEGVHELDPDERLLMAMSSSAKPLISSLQELSSRKMEAHSPPVSDLEDYFAERAWIAEAQAALDELRKNAQKDGSGDDKTELPDLVRELLETRHAR